MPKDTKTEIPATLERSPKKAQDIYAETLDSAEKTYDGDEAAAHRVAWSAVKYGFEKVADHWEAKDEKGPSDSRSEGTTEQKLAEKGETHSGVDVVGHTRDELLDRAKAAGVKATSRMTKDELGDAIARKHG